MFSARPLLFRKGVEEFNAGRFFEAHDVWEELWRESSGADKLFYQGLIQAAVGLYHISCGNFRGASSQLTKALFKLEQYLPAYHDIDTHRLTGGVRECLRIAESLRDGIAERFEPGRTPRIELQL